MCIRDRCKVGNELVPGADLEVVTGLCLAVTHGILLHSHESSAVSYTHLDVYKRQAVVVVILYAVFVHSLHPILEIIIIIDEI